MPQVCPLPPPSHAKLLLPAQTPITPVSSGIDHIFRADFTDAIMLRKC